MIESLRGLSEAWSWEDPTLFLGIATLIATVSIPVVVWLLGNKMNKKQVSSLLRQEELARQQRRDSLLETVRTSTDPVYLGILRDEINQYRGQTKALFLSVFRANPAVPLPTAEVEFLSGGGTPDEVARHFIYGLERRYQEASTHGFTGLLEFIGAARRACANIDSISIVDLVTGPAAEKQHPGHMFFRELVTVFPASASGLITAVGRIDYRSSGGLRLNVLTGTLLALRDYELNLVELNQERHQAGVDILRNSVPTSLATLMSQGQLRSFERWSSEGSTEPISATVAWLIRAVGWMADRDDHLSMRMIQNLQSAISSIPEEDRLGGWGVDAGDVRHGIETMRVKQPMLWEKYGPSIEKAALTIGKWAQAKQY